MFTYIPLQKDTLKDETIKLYAKYDGKVELFETKAFSVVHEGHLIEYLEALEFLFIAYNVPEEYFSDLMFIIGQHLFIYGGHKEKRADAFEASELLLFLKNYHLQNEELKNKFKRGETQVLEDGKRYVEFTSSFKTSHPIKLHNVHFIARGIYKLFRSQSYNHLIDTLEPFEEIPPIEIVEELLDKNQFIIDYADRYFLAELVTDLTNYLEKSVANKYRFIFDLLYISQLFYLSDKSSKDIEMMSSQNRFDTSEIISTFKTSYIKDILKAHKIYIKRNK